MAEYATLRCPVCERESQELMPDDACVHFYECPGCQTVLRPRSGECCVFCSYAGTVCPPRRRGIGTA